MSDLSGGIPVPGRSKSTTEHAPGCFCPGKGPFTARACLVRNSPNLHHGGVSMKEGRKQHAVLGNDLGRKIGPEGSPEVHRSQWFPECHPRTCEIPYLLSPTSIS